MEYYVLAFLLVAGVNWLVGRYATPRTKRLAFMLSAGAPFILWAGLNIWLLVNDGAATLQDPYFFVLLSMTAAFTVITTIAAFLGRQLSAAWKR